MANESDVSDVAERKMLNDAWLLLDRCMARVREAIEVKIRGTGIVEAMNLIVLNKLREEIICNHVVLRGIKPFSDEDVNEIRIGLEQISDYLMDLKRVIRNVGVELQLSLNEGCLSNHGFTVSYKM